MNTISRTHREFSRIIDDRSSLVNPEIFLGPNYKEVLNFWLYLDDLTFENRKEIKALFHPFYKTKILSETIPLSFQIISYSDRLHIIKDLNVLKAIEAVCYIVNINDRMFHIPCMSATFELITNSGFETIGFFLKCEKPFKHKFHNSNYVTKYSRIFHRFVRVVHDMIVYKQPERFLGPNYKEVLNFWSLVDNLSESELKAIKEKCEQKFSNEFCISYNKDLKKIISIISCNWRDASHVAKGISYTVDTATLELIGMYKIFEEENPLTFFELFLNL